MSKEFRTILITAIVAILIVIGIVYITKVISDKDNENTLANALNQRYSTNNETKPKTDNQNIEVILSLEDKITDNSIWCRNI